MGLKNDIGWMCGTLYLTKDACERECKVLHHRLGIKEAPRAVIPVEALRKWLEGKVEDRAWNIFDEGQISAYQELLSELEG